jgi:hypothetical protein
MRNSATPARVALAIVAAIAAAVSLGGCVQASHVVIPTSAPSVAPVFASDAQALGAAEKAYAAYLAVSDSVAQDGGNNVERLAVWETPAQFGRDKRSFAQMHAQDHHTSGSSRFSNASLQKSGETTSGKPEVTIYVCLDISQTLLLDAAGKDVGSARPLVLPLEVSFQGKTSSSRSLLVDRSVTWSGTNFCS